MVQPGLLYFAYGCNMDRGHLSRILERQLRGTAARLRGWRLRFNKKEADGHTLGNLEKAERCETLGVVFRLPRDVLPALDRFEGAPEHYHRVTLWVEPLGRPATQAATLYLARTAWIVPDGSPPAWYLDLLISGAREHGIPEDYIEWVQDTAAAETDDCYPRTTA